MKMHARAIFQRSRRSEKSDARVEAIRRTKDSRRGQHHSAADFLALDSRKIHGRALARNRYRDRLPAGMQAANANAFPRGIHLDFIFGPDNAGNQGACDDGAESFHRKGAVNRQPEMPAGILRRDGLNRAQQLRFQGVYAYAGPGAQRNHGCAFEERAAHEFLDFEAHEAEGVGIDKIGFRQRNDAARDSEKAANVEMLPSLRFDAFVGRDDKKDEINATDTSKHVAHEALVARHVHEAEANTVIRRIQTQIEKRKTEVDGDTAALFLFEAVRVRAGQRFNER